MRYIHLFLLVLIYLRSGYSFHKAYGGQARLSPLQRHLRTSKSDKSADVEVNLESMWGEVKRSDHYVALTRPSESLERLYSSFLRDVLLLVDLEGLIFKNLDEADPFDAVVASRQHAELLYTLIKSDVQNRRDDDEELLLVTKKEFPPTYRRALQFISDVLETIKNHNTFSSLYRIVNISPGRRVYA